MRIDDCVTLSAVAITYLILENERKLKEKRIKNILMLLFLLVVIVIYFL